MLPHQEYIKVIEKTPLVSIDIIVRDIDSDTFLLGKRKNNPAKGTWFVPGSRIYKGESLCDGLVRVCKDEIGYDIRMNDISALPQQSLGPFPIYVYEHVYDNNFMNALDNNGESISTHYIVLSQNIALRKDQINKEIFSNQHEEIRWFTKEEILENPDVHENTKVYFRPGGSANTLFPNNADTA